MFNRYHVDLSGWVPHLRPPCIEILKKIFQQSGGTLFRLGDFYWSWSGNKYLGTLFHMPLGDLIQVHFEPLQNKFKIDLEQWSPLFLSLWSKVNVIKINSTPKFNYVFQALSMKIPSQYLKQFDRLQYMHLLFQFIPLLLWLKRFNNLCLVTDFLNVLYFPFRNVAIK